MQNKKFTLILSSVGALGGLAYAFSNKKKFWGYVGFFILGSVAGSLAGTIIDNVVFKAPETTEIKK